jgi:hypothetical protein
MPWGGEQRTENREQQGEAKMPKRRGTMIGREKAGGRGQGQNVDDGGGNHRMTGGGKCQNDEER